MNTSFQMSNLARSLALIGGVVLLAACSSMPMMGGMMGDSLKVTLAGNQEVPPVTTSAAGSGTITIAKDQSVSGSVTVTGIAATAAHIHEAAMGVNGAVIVPLTKTSDNTFTVPANAKLTDAQYASYKAGKLYVNVHSAANPGGEIRAQLMK